MGKLKLYPEMIKDGSDGYLKVRDGFLSAEIGKAVTYMQWESKQDRGIRESIERWPNKKLPVSLVHDGSKVESERYAGSYALVCKKPGNLMKYRAKFEGIHNKILDEMLKMYDEGNVVCSGCDKLMRDHVRGSK